MKRLLMLLFLFVVFIISFQSVYAKDYGLDYVRLSFLKPESLKMSEVIQSSDKLYLELAKAAYKSEKKDRIKALSYYAKAVFSYVKSPEGAFNIMVLLVFSVIVALFLSIVTLSLSRLITDTPLFVHEISEAPGKLLYISPLLLGILDIRLMLLALLFLISFHLTDRQRKTLIAIIVIAVLSYFVYDYGTVAVKVQKSLPMKAITLVNSNKSNIPAMRAFNNSAVFEEGFSHGLSLLKEQRPEMAIDVYKSLESKFKDPRIYVNLGYLYATRGQTEKAEENFNKALNHSETASAFYNLSMLFSERLDFKRADEYFLKAVKLDFQRITAFREKNKENATPLYMYDQLRNAEVFRYVIDRTFKKFIPQKTTLYSTIYGVFVIIIILLSGKKYKHRAIKCPKCGKIHCIKCERHIYWNGLCSNCYSALVSFQAEPSDRVKVILKTYEFSRRQRMIKGIFSFFIPGFLLMQGEKIVRGVSHTFLFSFLLVLGLLGMTFEPLYLKGIHRWITYPAFILAIIIYFYSCIYTFKRVRKGWL